jgi:hypothetical protein
MGSSIQVKIAVLGFCCSLTWRDLCLEVIILDVRLVLSGTLNGGSGGKATGGEDGGQFHRC